ncbi:MAG: SDR family oxidoreductase [Myxococcales bacterium]
MKVLVVGATGGSGRAAVAQLLAQGHEVTAFCRAHNAGFQPSPRLTCVSGDATDAASVEHAVMGQDAVVVTLGITENPFRVRLWGPARTPLDVRSRGTRNVIAAMRRHGVRKLVVQTSYGVGATRELLGTLDRLFFELVLKPQIADTELQDHEVSQSDLDWVLVQPVHLTDEEHGEMPFVSPRGETAQMKVSRRSVGRLLARAVDDPSLVRTSLSVSGARAASA